MKKRISLSFLILSFFMLQSCYFLEPSVRGNGNVVEETRQISNFHGIKSSTGMEVILIPDSTEYVVVRADENLHEYIKTELSKGVLKVYTETRIKSERAKQVFIHYVSLNELQASSGSSIRTDQVLVSDKLQIDASSGAQQYLEITCSEVDIEVSSGAQIKASGKAEKGTLKASSGAQMQADNLKVEHAKADASSGGHISFAVGAKLDAEASSGGHINYHGSPQTIEVKSSSGGQINQK